MGPDEQAKEYQDNPRNHKGEPDMNDCICTRIIGNYIKEGEGLNADSEVKHGFTCQGGIAMA